MALADTEIPSLTLIEGALAEELAAYAEAAGDYADPFDFADAFLNNLPAIAYALGAGMPVTAWEPARRNAGEAERVLRATRQWTEQARLLLLALASGVITAQVFYDQLVVAFTRQARNSYMAGRRAVGVLDDMDDEEEAYFQDELADDVSRLGSLQAGSLGGVIAAMLTDPTNFLGSGLPGDPLSPHGAREAHKGLSAFNNRVEQYGARIGSLSNAGELDALTGAYSGDATIVWWSLGNTDHCIDCIRLADMSPFYARTLEDSGIYPGSGHTLCGGRCGCGLDYDIPSQVCADGLLVDDLGDMIESGAGLSATADGRRVNAWVQEAASCSLPVNVSTLNPEGDYDVIDSADAFSWGEDLDALIEQGPTVGWEAIAAQIDRIKRGVQTAKPVPGAQKVHRFLSAAAERDVAKWQGVQVTRYEAAGSVYHAAWRETADAFVLEAGVVTDGLTVLDPEFTLRALRDLAERAAAAGKRVEVSGATAGPGLRQWLDTVGAEHLTVGGLPPRVTPDFPAPSAAAGAVRLTPSPPEVQALPGWPELSSLKEASPEAVDALGGTERKRLLVDPAGNEWVFKPKGADAEVAAGALAQELGLRAPGSRIVELDGQRGALLPIVPGADSLYARFEMEPDVIFPVEDLTAPQMTELARQSVLDFVLANNDSHSGNWLLDEQGRLWGIDRSRALAPAVASSKRPESFWQGLGGGVFGEAVQAPDVSGILLKVDPADVAQVLDRLDAISDARYLDLVGPGGVEAVVSPFGTTAQKGEALLERKALARDGYAAMFREALGKASETSVGPRWAQWLEDGGTFAPRAAAAAPAPQPVAFLPPAGTRAMPAGYRSSAKGLSEVGNNLAVWQEGFVMAGTKADARQRLFSILTGAPDDARLDGLGLQQLNAVLARAEHLQAQGVDLGRITSLSDFGAVPEAERAQAGISAGGNIALNERNKWAVATAPPPLAELPVDPLFAQAAEEAKGWDEIQTGQAAWLKGYRGVAAAGEDIPTYLGPDLADALGRDYLLGDGLYVSRDVGFAARFGDVREEVVRVYNPYVVERGDEAALKAIDPGEIARQGYDSIIIRKGADDFSPQMVLFDQPEAGLTTIGKVFDGPAVAVGNAKAVVKPTVYDDIGGLFAHEVGHGTFHDLTFEAQARVLRLYEEHAATAAADLSAYATTGVDEWFGELFAAITAPGYVEGTVGYDRDVLEVLAADGKVRAHVAELPAPKVTAKVDLPGIAPDVRGAVDEELRWFAAHFPDAASRLARVEWLPEGVAHPVADMKVLGRTTWNKAGTKATIQLRRDRWLDPELAARRAASESSGQLARTGSATAGLTHELGHVLARGEGEGHVYGLFELSKTEPALSVYASDSATENFAEVLASMRWHPPAEWSAWERSLADRLGYSPAPIAAEGKAAALPGKPWFAPGDAALHEIPGSPIPLNAPAKEWSGHVPEQPPLPAGLRASRAEVDAARKAADEVTVTIDDVVGGKAAVAWSWRESDAKAAQGAGLLYEKVGGARLIARGESDLKPFRDYLAVEGHTADDDAFWHLLGYSDKDLAKIDGAYDIAHGGKRLSAGVMVVEPDGRVWVLSPKRKFAGYENTVFKGGVDPDELAAAAAVREVFEEGGLSVELDAYLGDYLNTDKTGMTRMYVGHRTGGGPAFASAKETHQVRLVTPEEAQGMLTRFGKPDARDQAILADARALLEGTPGTVQHVVHAEDVAELADKLAPLPASPPKIPGRAPEPPKHYGVNPAYPFPQPASASFAYDPAAVHAYAAGSKEVPPAEKFPYAQTLYKLPDGTTQPMYWKVEQAKGGGPEPIPSLPEPKPLTGTGSLEALTADEVGAVDQFTGATDDWQTMIQYLRSGYAAPGTEPSLKAAVKALDSALDKAGPLPTGGYYRGLQEPTMFGVLTSAEIKPGLVFTDPSFASTSLDKGVAASYGTLVMKVEPEPGLKGLDVQTFNDVHHPGAEDLNHEVIFDRNTTYEVLGVSHESVVLPEIAGGGPGIPPEEVTLVRVRAKPGVSLTTPPPIAQDKYIFWANSKKQVVDPHQRFELHVAQIPKLAEQVEADAAVAMVRVNEALLAQVPGLRDMLVGAGGVTVGGKYVEVGRQQFLALAKSISDDAPLPAAAAHVPTAPLVPTAAKVTVGDVPIEPLTTALDLLDYDAGATFSTGIWHLPSKDVTLTTTKGDDWLNVEGVLDGLTDAEATTAMVGQLLAAADHVAQQPEVVSVWLNTSGKFHARTALQKSIVPGGEPASFIAAADLTAWADKVYADLVAEGFDLNTVAVKTMLHDAPPAATGALGAYDGAGAAAAVAATVDTPGAAAGVLEALAPSAEHKITGGPYAGMTLTGFGEHGDIIWRRLGNVLEIHSAGVDGEGLAAAVSRMAASMDAAPKISALRLTMDAADAVAATAGNAMLDAAGAKSYAGGIKLAREQVLALRDQVLADVGSKAAQVADAFVPVLGPAYAFDGAKAGALTVEIVPQKQGFTKFAYSNGVVLRQRNLSKQIVWSGLGPGQGDAVREAAARHLLHNASELKGDSLLDGVRFDAALPPETRLMLVQHGAYGDDVLTMGRQAVIELAAKLDAELGHGAAAAAVAAVVPPQAAIAPSLVDMAGITGQWVGKEPLAKTVLPNGLHMHTWSTEGIGAKTWLAVTPGKTVLNGLQGTSGPASEAVLAELHAVAKMASTVTGHEFAVKATLLQSSPGLADVKDALMTAGAVVDDAGNLAIDKALAEEILANLDAAVPMTPAEAKDLVAPAATAQDSTTLTAQLGLHQEYLAEAVIEAAPVGPGAHAGGSWLVNGGLLDEEVPVHWEVHHTGFGQVLIINFADVGPDAAQGASGTVVALKALGEAGHAPPVPDAWTKVAVPLEQLDQGMENLLLAAGGTVDEDLLYGQVVLLDKHQVRYLAHKIDADEAVHHPVRGSASAPGPLPAAQDPVAFLHLDDFEHAGQYVGEGITSGTAAHLSTVYEPGVASADWSVSGGTAKWEYLTGATDEQRRQALVAHVQTMGAYLVENPDVGTVLIAHESLGLPATELEPLLQAFGGTLADYQYEMAASDFIAMRDAFAAALDIHVPKFGPFVAPEPVAAAVAPAQAPSLLAKYGVSKAAVDALPGPGEILQAQGFSSVAFAGGPAVKLRASAKTVQWVSAGQGTTIDHAVRALDVLADKVHATPTIERAVFRNADQVPGLKDLLVEVGQGTPVGADVVLTRDEVSALRKAVKDDLAGAPTAAATAPAPAPAIELVSEEVPLAAHFGISQADLGTIESVHDQTWFGKGSTYTQFTLEGAGTTLPYSAGLGEPIATLKAYAKELKTQVRFTALPGWGSPEQRRVVAWAMMERLAARAAASGKGLWVSGDITRGAEEAKALLSHFGAVKKKAGQSVGYELKPAQAKAMHEALQADKLTVEAAPPPPLAVAPEVQQALPPSTLATVYGYDGEAVQEILASPNAGLLGVSETPLTKVYDYSTGTGTMVRFAEEQQGQARIVRVRQVTGAMYGSDRANALVAAIAKPLRSYVDQRPEVARLLVDKKALAETPKVAAMLSDAGWKETKDYWVLDRAKLPEMADQLQAGKAPWMATGPIGEPAPHVAATYGTPSPALTGKASPSFIYDYDQARVKELGAALIDTVGADASLQAGAVAHVASTGGITARWSTSPSGKTVGWYGLEVAPGTPAHQAQDAAFAVVRRLADEARQRDGFFWIKPEVYDQVPGLRQLMIDAGGVETSYAKLGTAVQMEAAKGDVLVKAIDQDVMTGLKVSAQTTSDYLGFDPLALEPLLKAEPAGSPEAGKQVWKVGNASATLKVKAADGGRAVEWVSTTASGAAAMPAAVAEIYWAGEHGVERLTVRPAAIAGTPKLDKFLLAAGARGQADGSLVLDAAAINNARKIIGKDALPVLLGGQALPYSIVDDLNATLADVVDAATSHLVRTDKLAERASFTVNGVRVETTYSRSTSNIFWRSIEGGQASAGQVRAAATAQLRAMLNEVAQHAGMARLDVDLRVLADYPALREVLVRYGAAEVAADGREVAYLSLDRVKAVRLRNELEAELAAFSPAGAATYIQEQAALIKWPAADELADKPARAAALGGQTRKNILVDKDGNEWLFKPGATGRGALTDKAVAQLAAMLGLPVPPVRIYTVEIGGRQVTGSLQKMLPDGKGMLAAGIPSPAGLTAAQTEDLFRHSVLDWIVNNDDAHIGNWLVDGNGKLWSIDKSRAFGTFHGAHDVLSTASEGNGGGTPWLFQFFREARANPELLKKVHPSTLAATLRKLRSISDDEYRRILDPVARASQLKAYAGQPERLLADMLKRKNEAVADFERYLVGEVRTIQRAHPAAVPADWAAWLKKPTINLDATPKDLWMERKAALDGKFGVYSSQRAQQLLGDGHLSAIHREIRAYFGSGASGSGSGKWGAELVRPRLVRQKLEKQMVEWQELNEWALLNVVSGASTGTSWDSTIRKFWDPERGTLRVIRTTNRYGTDPARYIDNYTQHGMRDMVGTALGRKVTVGGHNGVVLYMDVGYDQVFSQFYFGYGAGEYEQEVLVFSPRVDQIVHVSRQNHGEIALDQLMAFNGPVVSVV